MTVPQALQAVENVTSELSPRTHAALEAITGALVSLASELRDARQDGDRLRAHVARLEARLETMAMHETPGSDWIRTPRPWTGGEDRRLVELAAQGLGVAVVAIHLDRSFWAVWRRSRRLGVTWRSNADARGRTNDPSRVPGRMRGLITTLVGRTSPVR